MNEQFVVPSLGNCRIQSPLPLSTSSKEDNFRFVEDSQRILYQATFNNLDQHELFGYAFGTHFGTLFEPLLT